jgi:HAD superfamily hydrolase (TIGR01509 family)
MKAFLDKFEAVIFDMDGLLLDTEQIALQAFREACRQFDFEPSLDVYMRCVGTNPARTKVILTQGYGPGFPFEKISPVWSENYRKAINDFPVPAKKGARDFLEFVRREKKKMALATSTAHQTAQAKLQRTGLLSFFEVIVGGDQVTNGKPDPETFLKAAGLLGVAADRCLVLEDSDNGVLAAHNAGMVVIQIPDLKEPAPEIRSLGHPILSSFKEVEDFLKNL